MSEKIRSIQIEKLLAHPDNTNVMSEKTFRKLVRHIEWTGLYEPIVVRPHPKEKNHYEIINGHHRVKAIQQLGHKEADCVVWNVDDGETAILLTTLNRLGGSDVSAKKIELLRKLTVQMKPAQLAKLLPQTAGQIERLTNLKLNSVPVKLKADNFAVPFVFFVTKQQKKIIEKAMETAFNEQRIADGSVKIDSSIRSGKPELTQNDKLTKAQRMAAGITEMAEQFLREVEKCRK
jgi:ParB/RepB/Spo0J family partition protein